jgi:hypothetical protein
MSRLGFQPENVGDKTGLAVGYHGTDLYISDTDTHTGAWKAFVVIDEATINAITDNGGSASTVPTATAIPTGTFVSANGVFTSIDLTSGSVAMYRA